MIERYIQAKGCMFCHISPEVMFKVYLRSRTS